MPADSYLSLLARKQIESIVRKIRSNSSLTPLDIVDLSDKDLELVYSMGYTFYAVGQYEKAKSLFLKLIFSQPFHPAYWKALGCTCQMLDQTADGVVYFSVALLMDPNDPLLHLYTAKALMDLKRYDEAKGALLKAEELSPKDDLDFQTQIEVLYERCKD